MVGGDKFWASMGNNNFRPSLKNIYLYIICGPTLWKDITMLFSHRFFHHIQTFGISSRGLRRTWQLTDCSFRMHRPIALSLGPEWGNVLIHSFYFTLYITNSFYFNPIEIFFHKGVECWPPLRCSRWATVNWPRVTIELVAVSNWSQL